MNQTKIEWVKNPDGSPGFTWNPITGCQNHDNGLCRGGGFPCYAYRLANGRLRSRYLANKNYITTKPEGYEYPEGLEGYPNLNPFYPRFWPDRVRENFGAYTNGAESKGIFVCDMSDLFGIGIPEEWTRRILNKIGMSYYREHRFYLLTKQPQNLANFSPFPDNCWVGVTITDGNTCAGGYLRGVEAKVKFISFEPLLKWANYGIERTTEALILTGAKWVIIGAQTKPYKPPRVEWVQEIVEACDKAGIPVFLKDNLKPLVFADPLFAEGFVTWTGELRQEMPK